MADMHTYDCPCGACVLTLCRSEYMPHKDRHMYVFQPLVNAIMLPLFQQQRECCPHSSKKYYKHPRLPETPSPWLLVILRCCTQLFLEDMRAVFASSHPSVSP